MAGRIITMQRQARELGRLRSGYTDHSGAKPRPVRSSTWIVTSHGEEYVRAAAELWGGTPEKWQPLGAGAAQWRVTTQASAIDAIMPPGDPLSQAYEMWSRGGCARRCDGETEQLSDAACLCRAEFGDDFHLMAKDKRCQATTRLSLILPAMPDIGVFRVETHGHYAANEIAATVDVIRGATGGAVMVPVQARIEPRTRVSEGKTKQFPVIVLALRGVTAGQILSGTASFSGELTGSAKPAPLGAGAAAAIGPGPSPAQQIADRALDATSTQTLRAIWADAKGHLDEVITAADRQMPLADLLMRLAELLAGQEAAHKAADPAAIETARQSAWMEALAAAPEGWKTDEVQADFAARHDGVHPESADAEQLRAYAAWLRNPPAAAPDAAPADGNDEEIPF